MLTGRAMFMGCHPAVNEKDRFMSTILATLARAHDAIRPASGRLARAIAATIVPPTCCLSSSAGQAPDLDLCEVCARALPRHMSPACMPDSGQGAEPAPVRVFAPFLYTYPVDRFVRALKFRGERVYARVLGLLLAQAYRACGREPPQMILPIPLHDERYRERGFNQACEIARYAAARLHVSVDAHCLERKSATREQSGLSVVERRRNVRGAFEVVRPPRAMRVALLDDVLTTGSTASAAVHALKRACAIEVEMWAVARVPRPGMRPDP
jgi:ComF family protein